ncbi:MAG: hypothetical protein ACOYXC_17705 [Candidatus Rifleibacteriota bacterium]
MIYRRFWLSIIFLTLSALSSPAFAFNNTYEAITSVVPDTGNMNEPTPANRKFSAQFTVELSTSTVEIYKSPQNASGTPETINVKAYISWRNDENYVEAYSGSFTPANNNSLNSAKTFSFSIQNPTSWGNPARLVIMARYGSIPSGPPFSFNGRGDIWNNTISMPPPSADVSLGGGSTYYESLDSFTGSIGEALPNGTVKINFDIGVKIFINPLGGAYDPTAEGVRVWADMTGGTNPTTLIFEQAKLAGAWWAANGYPSLPFILPFSGSFVFPNSTPGVIVGGVGLRWPPFPVLGANTVWGQQNTYTWRLPPQGVNISVPNIVFESVSNSYSASAVLRSLQINSRIKGYQWFWGDGSNTGMTAAGQTSCTENKTYNTPGVYNAKCVIHYKNSDTYTTSLEVPFTVEVKPLPRIYPPDQVVIREPVSGNNVLFPGEDTNCNYQAEGQTQLVCQQNKENDYFLYYRFFENPAVNSFTQSADLTKAQQLQAVSHKFTSLGQKKVELWVRYRKAEIQGGNLVNVAANNADGYFHHRLKTRTVTVESQTVLEGDSAQRITFSVSKSWNAAETDFIAQKSLTINAQSAVINFTGSANIFYARRDENSNDALDQKSGVRPGSVQYRWKILTPDNQDACTEGMAVVNDQNLLNWQTLANTSTTISPISVTFRVPFGTTVDPERYYRVFIEAKYKELAWKPVYSANDPSKIINWEDSPTYANNSRIREIIFNSTDTCSSPDDFRDCSTTNSVPPLNKEGSDLLFDGSMRIRVRILDLIPARFELISVPLNPTTGDSLADPEIRVRVIDNNPDARLNLLEIKYRRFDQTAYSMSSELTALMPADGSSNSLQCPETASMTYESIASADFQRTFPVGTFDQAFSQTDVVAFYQNSVALLPDCFAVTMAGPHDGKMPFRVLAHLDDGVNYFIESSQLHLEVADNDAPELAITMVNSRDNTTRSYSLTGGFTDLPTQAAKISLVSRLNDTQTYSEEKEEILPENAGQRYEIPADQIFTGIAHQRFLCSIVVTDNVKPAANLELKLDLEETGQSRLTNIALNEGTPGKFSGTRPEYLFYMTPSDLRRLKIDVTDGAGNHHGLDIPLKIVPPGQTEIRVLQQNNKN